MNKMKPIFFFLLLGITLSLFFSSGQIENPDTHLRLTQTRILLEDRKLGFPEDVGENSHGNIAIGKNGRRYMVYNPGQSIIFIPIYFIAKQICQGEGNAYYFSAWCVSFINYIIHALCSYFLYKIALTLGAKKREAYITSIFFALTSYSFVFAQSTYEHHFEMLFILISFYLSIKNNGNKSGITTGLIISLGLLFRYTIILALPIILILQRDNLERIKVTLTVILGVGFVLFYNYYRFANPFETGYGLAWKLAHAEKIKFWSLSNLKFGILGFLISPGKGLLFFSPTILISCFGVKKLYINNRLIFKSIILLTVTYIIFFSLNFAWHGSIWSYGPRYILPILPFLYIPLIYIETNKWIINILILSTLIQIELITVNYKRNVLSDYIKYGGLSDNDYIFDLKKEPHLIQAQELVIIAPKNFNKLYNYYPDSPWKKEIRTTTNEEFLKNSIEKNSINFWWIRIFHTNSIKNKRGIIIIILILGCFSTITLINHVKKELI